MKTLLSLLLLLFSGQATSQFYGIANDDLKVLVGKWSGNSVFTQFIKGKMQSSFATSLNVVDMKDSIVLKFTHKGADGKKWEEEYPMRIYDDQRRLVYDSSEFEIESSRKRGLRLTIYAERSGVDDFRSADFLHTIIFDPANLSIVKEVRYMDMVDYSIRYRMTFTKNRKQ